MGPQKAVDREFVFIDVLLFFVCFGSCSLFLLLSSFFFFVPPKPPEVFPKPPEAPQSANVAPSCLHIDPSWLHLESSWLHLGSILAHLGSPKPPQISFGSPEIPRAKNWLHLASVWTASWLHGDRFSRSYSITLGCPIDVPFVVNGCPQQKSVFIFP